MFQYHAGFDDLHAICGKLDATRRGIAAINHGLGVDDFYLVHMRDYILAQNVEIATQVRTATGLCIGCRKQLAELIGL